MSSKLADARALLGVTRDSTLEEARAIYKRKAMVVHPDKNNNSEESTIEFQKLGAAMHEIQKSHEAPSSHCPCGRDHDDDDHDEDDEDYEDSGAFFAFMFEQMFSGGGGRGGGGRPPFMFTSEGFPGGMPGSRQNSVPFDRRDHFPPEESSDAFRARKKAEWVEQEKLAKLNAAKEKADKENLAQKRQQDSIDGEKRRDAKNAARKQKVADDKAAAAKRATDLIRKAQQYRSDAFQAARDNQPAIVKRLVYEENVGASDVEFAAGFLALPTDPIASPPESPPAPLSNGNGINGGGKNKKKKKKGGANGVADLPAKKVDSKETLLHLAAINNDPDLVAWLIDHGASPEERDAKGYSALHRALGRGHCPVVETFLSLQEPIYPPPSADSSEPDDAFYPTPPGETLLSLAVNSGSPEAVALMVPYTTAEIAQENWVWISEVMKGRGRTGEMDKWEQMRWELAEVEGLIVEAAYRRTRKSGR